MAFLLAIYSVGSESANLPIDGAAAGLKISTLARGLERTSATERQAGGCEAGGIGEVDDATDYALAEAEVFAADATEGRRAVADAGKAAGALSLLVIGSADDSERFLWSAGHATMVYRVTAG